MTGKPNALTSLWGKGGVKKEREQETLTPDWLPATLIQGWGSIILDPCAEAAPSIDAAHHYIWPERDGLALPWTDPTYANPPYKYLRAWLEKARDESVSGFRIALLAPVRTHRWWYRSVVRTCQAVIDLNPLTFKGYNQSFPAPLVLLCWNWTPTRELWKDRGDVRPAL